MSSEDIVISVRNLDKTYRLFGHPGDRIKQFFSLGMRKYHNEFTALQDISFDIRKGETVGIIGRNGSGKSTLLQLICGILKPTAGSVIVNGRISALLELGAGFNPEFTGRENVYFQGAVMGISKEEMDSRIGDIAAFADIGEFIDQPVRVYSSGMFVRLAFSVAVHVEPEILVVDEALAVGDASFQAKCFHRLRTLCDKGVSILLVTHAVDQLVNLCQRALLLEQGRLISIGAPVDVSNYYLSIPYKDALVIKEHAGGGDAFSQRPGFNQGEYRFGEGGASIVDFELLRQGEGDSQSVLSFRSGELAELRYRVSFHRKVEQVTFAVAISTLDGRNLFGVNSRDLEASRTLGPFRNQDEVIAVFKLSLNLAGGDYLISLSVSEEILGQLEPLDRRYDSVCLSIGSQLKQRGMVHMSPSFGLETATGESHQ